MESTTADTNRLVTAEAATWLVEAGLVLISPDGPRPTCASISAFAARSVMCPLFALDRAEGAEEGRPPSAGKLVLTWTLDKHGIAGFERVFETGHVYRAEPHATSRHLTEYYSLDLEIGFIDGPKTWFSSNVYRVGQNAGSSDQIYDSATVFMTPQF